MNRVALSGRWTRDPEVRTAQSGIMVARNTLAVDRFGKDQSADFISCIAFGKTAEFLEKYGWKGIKMIVEGHIQTGSYTNKDNQKVYTTDVIIDRAEFCESKGANTTPTQEPTIPDFSEIPDIDEELPFN